MVFEHFALNVPDARATAEWYRENLGLTIARALGEAPHTHFLADSAGRVFLEIYTNPKDAIPAYSGQHPLRVHFGFAVTDARAECLRLRTAGAALVVEEVLGDGTILVMLRDPWGVPFQLCQRKVPF